jgi:hypothetical protein
MYEISYGRKYDKNLSTTEIAKRFREDLKAAIKAGTLPKGLKCSVRTKYFAGGSSIDVDVTALPAGFRLFDTEFLTHHRDRPSEFYSGERRTPEAKALLAALEKMLQAYNYDGSDIMTDYFNVNFYGHAGLGWKLEEACRLAETAAIPPASAAA